MKISAIFYAIVILAFLMPFFVVSCDKTELASLKGIKLVTGGEIETSVADFLKGAEKEDAKPENPSIKPQPYAILALVLAVVALVLVLVLPITLYLVPVIVSVLGIASLQFLNASIIKVLLSAKTGLDPSLDLSSIITIKAQTGFWLANVAFIVGGVFVIISGIRNRNKVEYSNVPITDNPDFRFNVDGTIPNWENIGEQTVTEPEPEELKTEEELSTPPEEEEKPE